MAFNLKVMPKMVAKHEAYPFQFEAFLAIENLEYSAVFHEQGLGKTKIGIDLALSWLQKDIVDTVFFVTKKALVQNWYDEIKSHTYITPKILSTNKRENSMALNSPVIMYVLNYELVSGDMELFELFLKTCRVGVILDESQKIKNPVSTLTENFIKLSTKFERRVIMTGTPVANRPFDIWSQIYFLDGGKSLGQSFKEFKAKSEIPSAGSDLSEYGKFIGNAIENLSDFVVRETKETSGIDLPGKSYRACYVDLEEKQLEIYLNYKYKLVHEFEQEGLLVRDDAEEILKRLLRLVQCACNPLLVDATYDRTPGKLVKLLEILEKDVFSKDAPENVIIWTSFVENVDWLKNNLEKYNPAVVHGRLTIDQRNQAIRKFKTDQSCKIFISTPGAAKEGLTLTNANHTIFYDRGFSLDDYLQAQDRIHRISQKKECFVYNLIANNSIDIWVDALLEAKYQAAKLMQGDISTSEFSEGYSLDLTELLEKLLK